MSEQEQIDNPMEREKRRKILKGLAGLPAVATLTPGAASANSNPLSCALPMDQGGKNPFMVDVDTPPGGFTNAERVQTEPVLVREDNNGNFRNIGRDESGHYNATGQPSLGNAYSDAGPGTPVREVRINNRDKIRHDMIFIDQNGGKSRDYLAGENHPVTASCLVSIQVFLEK